MLQGRRSFVSAAFALHLLALSAAFSQVNPHEHFNLVRRDPTSRHVQSLVETAEVQPASAASAAVAASTAGSQVARATAVLNWAKRNGADGVDNFVVTEFSEGGRTTAALTNARAVRSGETLLTLPANLTLNTGDTGSMPFLQKLYSDPKFGYLTKAMGATEHKLRLTAALIATSQAGWKDAWGDLITALPSSSELRGESLLLSEKGLLERFKDLPLIATISDYQLDASLRYDEFTRVGGHATNEEWAWAEGLVSTSAWRVPAGDGLVFVPVAGLVQPGGESKHNIEIRIGQQGGVEIVASRDLEAGMELMDAGVRGADKLADKVTEIWIEERPRPLGQESCSRLSSSVGSSLKDFPTSCQAPADVNQNGPFCKLAVLASEYCSKDCQEFPCKDGACQCHGRFLDNLMLTIMDDFTMRNAEKNPVLFYACVLLFLFLVAWRSRPLMNLKRPRDSDESTTEGRKGKKDVQGGLGFGKDACQPCAEKKKVGPPSY